MRSPVSLLLCLALGAGLARADVVTLQDGRVLEGLVREAPGGVLVVESPYGEFRVSRQEVTSWERTPSPVEEYERRLEELATDDAAAQYALARWCESKGLHREARGHFRKALALSPEHTEARRALGWRLIEGAWVPPEQVLQAAGFVQHEGRWVLPGERQLLQEPPESADPLRESLETLVAPDPLARQEAERLLREADRGAAVPALLEGLGSPRWDVRAASARLLGEVGGKEVDTSLVVAGLTDRVREVRRAAVEGLRRGTHPDAYAPFVRSLAAGERSIRIHAVQALAELEDPRAVGYLVKHIRYSGGGPRAHIYVANQIAYIGDYDVEVAQRAAIADPIIRYAQEGTVLDAQVLSIRGEGIRIERRITGRALSSLTGVQPAPGVEPGSDQEVAAWTRWWREHRHEYEPGGRHFREP